MGWTHLGARTASIAQRSVEMQSFPIDMQGSSGTHPDTTSTTDAF